MFGRKQSTLFRRERISEYLTRDFERIKKIVDEAEETYILNVDQTTYVEFLANNNIIGLPEIFTNEVTSDIYEDNVPAEYFPNSYDVQLGKSYKHEIIQFFIPCSGNTDMLIYIPNSMFPYSGAFYKEGSNLIMELVSFNKDAKSIKQRYDNEASSLHSFYTALRKDIEDYNFSLLQKISSQFTHRKQKILAKLNLLDSIGIPLRSKKNTPSTFAIPKPQLRERIVLKPVVYEKGFKPEPTLGDDDYRKILKLINDVGKNFERMPSLYEGKKEENLRDHILMTLDPNFELGSASGETFNKSGKTDIQLRYDSSVVFIGECKFWKGEKAYRETIDQLLGYLTWRDTKSTIIIFVTQKDFTTILHKIKDETAEHSNYLGFDSMTDENWFNFRIHLNGDKNRVVKMAVQLYVKVKT
ncbi:MAG: hypothetical protein JST83_11740 [Bacteroidetes bacterium]|nr:hypothetical protein [Bacteroidota bacterium]